MRPARPRANGSGETGHGWSCLRHLLDGARGRFDGQEWCCRASPARDLASFRAVSYEQVLDQVFGAVEAGDWATWRSAFADDAVLGQNVMPDVSVDDAMQMLPLMFADGTTVRYENIRRVSGPDSVTEMHDAVFTKPDGRVVRIDICAVMQFNADGKIIRGDEYLDSAAAAGLRE